MYQISFQLLEQHALSVETKSSWIGRVEVESKRQHQRVDILIEVKVEFSLLIMFVARFSLHKKQAAFTFYLLNNVL